jgi:hypothetical protein
LAAVGDTPNFWLVGGLQSGEENRLTQTDLTL